MKGFELIFIAARSRRHNGRPVLDEVARLAGTLDIRRMTRRYDVSGVGADGHSHSAHFFELTDEPEELMFVLDGDKADRLLRAVEEAEPHVFCLRRPIDYWQFGASD